MSNTPGTASATALPKISRRSLFAAVTGGLAMTGLPAIGANADRTDLRPDRALCAFGRDFERMVVEINRPDLGDAEVEEMLNVMTNFALYLARFEPSSLEGLRVKLQAYLWLTMDVWSPDDFRMEGELPCECAADHLLLSLAGDVVRLREVRP